MTTPDFAELVPMIKTLGMVVESASADEVVARLAYDERLSTLGGALNGGTLMALTDNTGGVCAYLNLPPDAAGTATTSSSTNFVRGARSDVVAVSRPLHVGRSSIVVVTEVRDTDGRLIVQTTQSQAVLSQT